MVPSVVLHGQHCSAAAPPPYRWIWPLAAISPGAASFERRGFVISAARPRLERSARIFVAGYASALASRPDGVLAALAEVEFERRGFFAEGAAMGAAIASFLPPWRDRLAPLLSALEPNYVHLAHVGAGWAMGRLPFSRRWIERRLDPFLSPLAIDGRGFQDGFFGRRQVMRRLGCGDASRVYDQGVGRFLWFSCGAEPEHIARATALFDPCRHADLWAGLGLAAVYAGGAQDEALDRLVASAGEACLWLRQGAAFAAAAHARAGAVPPAAADAALRLTRLAPGELIPVVAEAEAAARRRSLAPLAAYQAWRTSVARALER
jgi:hypothetical protein